MRETTYVRICRYAFVEETLHLPPNRAMNQADSGGRVGERA